MDNSKINRATKSGAVLASTDTKNPQERQVVASAGKLRIRVGKGSTGR